MRMRSMVYSIMVLLAFLTILTSAAKANETTILAIDPTPFEVPETQIGETIQLNITIANVANLWGWKVRLNWNPQVLNITQVEEGPFLKSIGETMFVWPYTSPTINEGYIPEITCGLLQATGANGSGVLATLTFKVLTSDASTISVNETQLLEPESPHQEILHTIVNSEVTIIPEFTIAIILPLFMVVTLFLIRTSRRVKGNIMNRIKEDR